MYAKEKPLNLITAADSSHFKSLLQLLGSVRRYEPGTPVHVYDLGLTSVQLDILCHKFPQYWVKKFDFSRYPPHFNIRNNVGEYAWKPAIVWEVLQTTFGPAVWMDAGNVLVNNLDGIRDQLTKHGFYSPHSPGTIAQWTHPGMLKYLGLAETWRSDARNLNGACIAFDPRSSNINDLAREWYEGAMVKECIAPDGSSRANHRQDQSLLTVLAYRAGLADAGEHSYIGFKIHQDVESKPLRALIRSFLRTINYYATRIR